MIDSESRWTHYQHTVTHVRLTACKLQPLTFYMAEAFSQTTIPTTRPGIGHSKQGTEVINLELPVFALHNLCLQFEVQQFWNLMGSIK